MTTTIDLLRHGEVSGGLRLRGYKDDPLSGKGWQQMHDAVKNKILPWDIISSSPLQRCALFADSIASQLNKPLQIHANFKEINFGDWEGQLVSDLYNNHPDQMNRFWNNPGQETPPNGEPYYDFEKRVNNAWETLIDTNQGKHTLLVTHGGTIRTVLRRVLGFPLQNFFNLEIPNASISRIIIDDKIPRISFINGQL